MKTTVTFDIDTDKLGGYHDQHLAALWHIAQANPAPIEDRNAGELAELIGREIIRRFLKHTSPELWEHQGAHHARRILSEHGKYVNGEWKPHAHAGPSIPKPSPLTLINTEENGHD
jgi:hypothetical protein